MSDHFQSTVIAERMIVAGMDGWINGLQNGAMLASRIVRLRGGGVMIKRWLAGWSVSRGGRTRFTPVAREGVALHTAIFVCDNAGTFM